MFQWLGLHIPSAGCPGSIPGQETRSHMPQLRVHMLQQTLNTQSASTKTQCSQMNKYLKKKKKKEHEEKASIEPLAIYLLIHKP